MKMRCNEFGQENTVRLEEDHIFARTYIESFLRGERLAAVIVAPKYGRARILI
jgi:hypothetical protein